MSNIEIEMDECGVGREVFRVKIIAPKVRKMYRYSPFYSDEYPCDYKEVQKVVVFDGVIGKPLLEIGENVFVNSLNKSFKIASQWRDVENDKIVYYSNDHAEVIVDGVTEKSKEEALKKKNEYKEERRKEDEKTFESRLNDMSLLDRIFKRIRD